MKSIILTQIKTVEVICLILAIWFVSYNTYFGWNMIAISQAEKNCDLSVQAIAGLAIGTLIRAILNTMKLVVNYIKSKHN